MDAMIGRDRSRFAIRMLKLGEFRIKWRRAFDRLSKSNPAFPTSNRNKIVKIFVSLLMIFVFWTPNQSLANEVSEGEKLFALKVKPLLAEKCLACHGENPEELGGELDLRTRAALLRGGESFGDEVVLLNHGKASILFRVVAHAEDGFEMPPKLADRLSEEQTRWLRDWIDAGAPWPDDDRVAEIQKSFAEGVQVVTSRALSNDWQLRRYAPEKLWAYRPINVTQVPNDAHPIDWFLDRRLADRELEPAGDADAIVMARRMAFGLTGLPPNPAQTEDFIARYEQDPGKAVLDFGRTLMSSPHYGEQFAQNWLDVTRYADSAGYANDYARPHAWRYRDYVVRAFNHDKSFNQFIKEQIAGDEIDPENREYLIATGFLRMGPWEVTSMSVFKEMRQFWLDDVVDSVGQTFLGHAMQCAKCHDHKFDPIPTRDYYRMMAVFSTTQFADRSASFLPTESRSNFQSADAWAKKKIAYYEEDLMQIDAKVAKLKQAETTAAKVGNNGLDPGDEASQARIRKNKTRHTFELDRTKPIAHSVYTGKTVAKKNIQGRIKMPKSPWKVGVFEPDVIYSGGSVYSLGDPVAPGALSAAESLGKMTGKPFPTGQGKRRLALAEWIVDPSNPLTARVIVNRVWSWHFGKGIAGNPNNFGGTGASPTHPELLDFLADWFIKEDWSVKKLNELIVTSRAYRRSSHYLDLKRLNAIDSKRELYAVFLPRRLTAEQLRDAMLSASGELNPELGGIPVRPDMNFEVATQPRQIMGGTASIYEPDPTPEQRNRRSLYTEKLRGLRDSFFETFNQPGFDDSCELRETSTVAPQALTMLNAEEIQDRALAFAARLIRESEADHDRAARIVEQAFRLAFSRQPTKDEMEACVQEWKVATDEEQQLKPEPRAVRTQFKRTVMAEKTGEPYNFIERTPAFESYVPDVQRSDVDAETRALAHICLVLFNSNEFAYLD